MEIFIFVNRKNHAGKKIIYQNMSRTSCMFKMFYLCVGYLSKLKNVGDLDGTINKYLYQNEINKKHTKIYFLFLNIIINKYIRSFSNANKI